MAEVEELEEQKQTEQEQSPEQQLLADETAGLAQMKVGHPLRHSVSASVSDFTGISNPTNFLASLTRWHACGITNGQVKNDAGPATVPYTWGLTRLGELFQQANPTISGLSPATAVHGSGQITVTVNGANFRGNAVVQAGGVPLPTTFVNSGQLTALYTPPAAAGSVPFTVLNPVAGGLSPSSAFTVT